MQIIIQSQYHENYGAHDWNGVGACPQYWKAKGGSEYRVRLSLAKVMELGGDGLAKLVSDVASKHINKDDNYSQEYVIAWDLLDDGQLTPNQEFFKDDGYHPEPIEISLNEIKPNSPGFENSEIAFLMRD